MSVSERIDKKAKGTKSKSLSFLCRGGGSIIAKEISSNDGASDWKQS